MFSEELRSALADAGWTPDRKVLTGHWVSQLVSEGFAMLPAAIEVLESFGGLEIHPLMVPSQVYRPGVLLFDPILATSGDFDRVDYWQKRLHMRLSPLGEISGPVALLLAEDGRIFSCRDTILWVVGASFEGAMENTLLIGKRWPVEYGRMSEDA